MRACRCGVRRAAGGSRTAIARGDPSEFLDARRRRSPLRPAPPPPTSACRGAGNKARGRRAEFAEQFEQVECLNAGIAQPGDQAVCAREDRLASYAARQSVRIEAGLAGHRDHQQADPARGELVAEIHYGAQRIVRLPAAARPGSERPGDRTASHPGPMTAFSPGSPTRETMAVLDPGTDGLERRRSVLELLLIGAQVRPGGRLRENIEKLRSMAADGSPQPPGRAARRISTPGKTR